MDIMRTHPMVIIGGILQENPFYAPPPSAVGAVLYTLFAGGDIWGHLQATFLAAVTGLELAAVWLRMGRLPEVKQLVAELLDVFRSRHVARESIAALLMLREALERDRVTRDLILSVASLLELHQDDAQAQL